MRLSEVMTHRVVTTPTDATLAEAATLMRDLNVGSVVVVEGERPVGLITDRDVALAIGADGAGSDEPVADYASRPLVTGETDMDLEEAAALMVQHSVRRLPILDGDGLAGIVTIDDLAVRAGDLELARRMTAEVAKAAIPEFYFHQRGG